MKRLLLVLTAACAIGAFTLGSATEAVASPPHGHGHGHYDVHRPGYSHGHGYGRSNYYHDRYQRHSYHPRTNYYHGYSPHVRLYGYPGYGYQSYRYVAPRRSISVGTPNVRIYWGF